MTRHDATAGAEDVSLIDIENVSLKFGGLRALHQVSLSIEEGVVTALVGPNGAGKTTLFNVISGFLRPSEGEVRLSGKTITGLPPYKVSRAGLVRSFQDVRVFSDLSVLENIMVAAEAAPRPTGPARTPEAVLEMLGLAPHRDVLARNLSYAEQKFISFGRMIASRAPVLLLDEPSSGLDAASLEKFTDLIRRLNGEGVTIVIVEHNLDIVRAVASRIAFMHRGELLAFGDARDILQDRRLSDVYLGGGAQ